MPMRIVYALVIALERYVTIYVYIVCVRLLRCPFYSDGQYQSLDEWNGQQVQALTLFLLRLAYRRDGSPGSNIWIL